MKYLSCLDFQKLTAALFLTLWRLWTFHVLLSGCWGDSLETYSTVRVKQGCLKEICFTLN